MLTRWLSFLLFVSAVPAIAAERGVMVRTAQIYLSPDANSAKLGEVNRGREIVVIERSRDWLHVMASVTKEQDITGWIVGKGVVLPSTPDGDKILFGEAATSELEASRRGGRSGSAQEAMRLYAELQENFPKSPLAGEALYRASDIRWQLDAEDVRTRPSAKERDPIMRPEIDDQYMREVEKKYPGTKWADLAAFRRLDNKLCGNWEGLAKCPEKEAEMYEKYAADHTGSPVAAEALYDAAWRRAALIDIYKTNNKQKQIDGARDRAREDAQQVINKYSETDWALRARALIYMIDQNIPTYGNTVE